ncbi:MAG: hypothetical protein HDT21_14010 [Ruminococcus sp.]|nr:hypothetical protein [Ruminococcus sp.]
MKIKKIIAGVAAAAMTVSTMAAMSVSAINEGGTVIDFEDGDYSFVYMNVDSGADNSVLSVEDYNGSKRLKVDVQDKANSPKVWFDLDKITDRSNTVQIRKITFDLTIVPKSAEGTVGWAGGAVGTAGGFDPAAKGSGQVNPSWSQKEWSAEAYDPGVAAEVKVERKFLMRTEFYTEEGTNPFFGLMRWPAADSDDYVMYIDNVQLLDEKDNALPIGVTPAPAETEAAPEETEAAPAETEAAPAEEAAEDEVDVAVVDDDEDEVAAPAETAAPVAEPAPAATEAAPAPAVTTTPAATGNTAVASIAAVMAIAGAAAIVAKKRK